MNRNFTLSIVFSALSRLRSMFGKEAVSKSKVVTMIRTKWNEDPFARGSYSFPAAGKELF